MGSSEGNVWVTRADVCRCCLSAAGTFDLTTSYVTDYGKKEIYKNTLQDCFRISLSDSAVSNASRLICSSCIGHILDANIFRKKVLEAERQFANYWYNKGNQSVDELLTIPIESQTFSKNSGTIRKTKAKLKINRERNKININEDYDSDTPISHFVKNFYTDLVEIRNQNKNNSESQNETKENQLKEACDANLTTSVLPHMVQTTKTIKNTSERKRVMLTCATILRDTNACPFRHYKSWFQCFYCSQEFMEISLLRDHNSQIHFNLDEELQKIKRYPRFLQVEISNLECRHCNLNLTDVDSMRRHFVDVHNKIIYTECVADYKVNKSPYGCHICKKEFHVFRTLTTHLNEHYANCICDVCGKSFLNSKRLKVHRRTHEYGQYPCNVCGKILKTKTSKANHIESAHTKRVLKCQICFEPMKHYNERVKHMSDVHNITHNFKCHICSREYNIKHYLATHIRQTHGHKNKKCTVCGMAFITNHGLKKHMVKHTGEKPYKCHICYKAYARNHTLKDHMRGHANELTFRES